MATRGFFGAVMSVRSIEEQEQFFIDALGFRKLGVDGAYHRFEAAGGGPGSIIDLHHEPDRAPGSWGFGAGTSHHIAFNVETTMKRSSRRRRCTRNSDTPTRQR